MALKPLLRASFQGEFSTGLRYTTAPMSPSDAATGLATPQDPTLDVTSFQKLLMAAWVIQCERDRLRDVLGAAESDSPPEVLAKDEPEEVSEPVPTAHAVMASLDSRDTGTPAEAPSKLPPARVERICSDDEVSGALALARDRNSPVPTAAFYSVPQVASYEAPKRPDPDVRSRSALIVLPFPARKAQSESAAARLLRSIPASVFIVSILVCVALIAFVTMRIERHRNLLRPSNGVSSQVDAQSAVVAHSNVDLPFLQSSHLRITDPLISSELGELSRYEVRNMRRQAEFGDDEAALILAMAEEVGQGAPQSCAGAAHWMTQAANDGNAAAQYNLGLRYLYGDGVPASHEESLRWLRASADQGYSDAQAALAHFNSSR